MEKGKMYICVNQKIIVLCTNGTPAYVDCFCGVVLKNTNTKSLLFCVGDYKDSLKTSDFVEHKGQVDLNNCSFNG